MSALHTELPSQAQARAQVQEASFALDLVIQLARLRQRRGLSQTALARLVNMSRQTISRLEDPLSDGQSLHALRTTVRALDAFVDIVVVPAEHLANYRLQRALPLLDSTTAAASPRR